MTMVMKKSKDPFGLLAAETESAHQPCGHMHNATHTPPRLHTRHSMQGSAKRHAGRGVGNVLIAEKARLAKATFVGLPLPFPRPKP